MPNERSAVDTITGYYYQFDYYILQLLTNPAQDDLIYIEAIEDVDIHSATDTTAVQCKYYAKTEYNHSVIGKPIRLMLDHFQANPATRSNFQYKLYGHFKTGQSKLSYPITLDFLKEKFLTYTKEHVRHEHHIDLGLNDSDLQIFLDHLTISINAAAFDAQERAILRILKETFHCNDFEAEFFYYNNALRVVRSLTTKQNEKDRAISPRDFKEKINQKTDLFDIWYIEFKGKREYCNAIREQYFSSLNISPCARFFLVDCDPNINENALKTLIFKISKKWAKLSARESKPFCPYIFLHGVSEQTILNIKTSIQNDNVYFIDGFDFKGAQFKATSIIRKPSAQNGIKFKFITDLNEIEPILDILSEPKIIYEFYLSEPYFQTEKYDIKQIKISDTEYISLMI